ncbi:MAG: hypothetical protein IT232_10460 [Flavobacteriales bacterium]|nr:hypothetical protein [Flavobacteriales bacterium]
MKNKKRIIFLLLFVLLSSINNIVLASGAPPPRPGGGGPGGGGFPCWPPPCVPIDGGISFLLLAGAIYGGKKIYDINKKAE